MNYSNYSVSSSPATGPVPPQLDLSSEQTTMMLSVFEEYTAKLATALDTYTVLKSRALLLILAGVGTFGLAIAFAWDVRLTDHQFILSPLAAFLVGAILILCGSIDLVRAARTRQFLVRIGLRLDKLHNLGISIIDRVSGDDVRSECINIKLAEVRLRIEQVEMITGKFKDSSSKPISTPSGGHTPASGWDSATGPVARPEPTVPDR